MDVGAFETAACTTAISVASATVCAEWCFPSSYLTVAISSCNFYSGRLANSCPRVMGALLLSSLVKSNSKLCLELVGSFLEAGGGADVALTSATGTTPLQGADGRGVAAEGTG